MDSFLFLFPASESSIHSLIAEFRQASMISASARCLASPISLHPCESSSPSSGNGVGCHHLTEHEARDPDMWVDSFCRTRLLCLWLLATNFLLYLSLTPRHPSVRALYLCKYDLELKRFSFSAEDTEGFKEAVGSHRFQVDVSRKRHDLFEMLNSCLAAQGRHPAELLVNGT